MFVHRLCRLFLFIFFGLISTQSFGDEKDLFITKEVNTEPSPETSAETSVFSTKGEQRPNNKPIQEIALQAFKTALQEDTTFLHISPNETEKILVLVQALKSRIIKWEEENKIPSSEHAKQAGKISIVTAHKIHLVDQLAFHIYQETKHTSVDLINWNNIKQRSGHKSFSFYLMDALDSARPTVFVMTTKSLIPMLGYLFRRHVSEAAMISSGFSLYERLAKNLDGIYIDQAHRLGASQTNRHLVNLWESGRAFLYGATATPFHHNENIIDLFERHHWSYLNKEGHLFEEHSIEDILDQLSLAIRNKDLTPFNDLYLIGESGFKEIKDQPVFIQGRGDHFILNPAHYNRLAQILYPVLSANRKGFIVTATIPEAERLQEFLSKTFKEIQFELYHSNMETEAGKKVLRNSKEASGFHYIIDVRALDEEVNMPHLSAYIDLNFTVSIRKMIQRIGKVLNLYPGKEAADILFLVDYKNKRMVRDISNMLEKVEQVFFREDEGNNENKRNRNSDLRFADLGITPLTRKELLELRKALQNSIRKLWSEKGFRWLTWEELREAIIEYNKTVPKGEWITSQLTYRKFYKKISGAPSKPANTYPNFKERGGWPALLKPTLKELLEAIIDYNKRVPVEERIHNSLDYIKYYKEIPGAPSIFTLYRKHPELRKTRGLLARPSKPVTPTRKKKRKVLTHPSKPATLTWEELRAAIMEYNKQTPEEEWIISEVTYRRFYKKIPGAPSNPADTYPDFKERGNLPGLLRLRWEELGKAIIEYNEQATEWEKITSEITYGKFYKRIPGAPSIFTVRNMHPDFKKKGGLQGLIRETCRKAFTTQ